LNIPRSGKDDVMRYQRDAQDEGGALLSGGNEVDMEEGRQERMTKSIDLTYMRESGGGSSYGTMGVYGSGKRGFYGMFQGDGAGKDPRKEEIQPTAERILRMGAGDQD